MFDRLNSGTHPDTLARCNESTNFPAPPFCSGRPAPAAKPPTKPCSAPTVECPNFFKLGDQWVLFVSPYGKVQYFVGDFDAATCRFTPRTRGLLDYGSSFYALTPCRFPTDAGSSGAG